MAGLALIAANTRFVLTARVFTTLRAFLLLKIYRGLVSAPGVGKVLIVTLHQTA